jgi:DNA-binding LacI/PurR family transcriptional regulator
MDRTRIGEAGTKPRLTDVANLAGVSHQTVSRVVNGNPRVKPETRRRVRAAMDELGYLPNSTARALATGRSQTIGAICYDTTLYGPAATLLGLEEKAREEGYSVNIVSVKALDSDQVKEAVVRLTRQAVAGIAIISPQLRMPDAFRNIPASVPVAAIWGPTDTSIPVIAVDEARGARLATQHLLDLGHRSVWHIAGPAGRIGPEQRLVEWRRTLERNNIDPPPPFRGEWSARSGYDMAKQLMKSAPKATSVFVANDLMALGVLTALQEADRRVPEDISVVGFDDIPEAAYFSPPLTTVRQEFHALGRRCASLILALLNESGTRPLSPSALPVELIVRRSSGPAPQ